VTERYAHFAPDHLHDAVDNLGFSARGKTKKGSALPEWLIYLVKWWARLGLNQWPLPCEGSCLPKPVPKTLNLSGTDSTQVDLKRLEMTGDDSFSSQFQLTPRPLFIEQ